MQKIYLIIITFFQITISNGQSDILVNENGVVLGYTSTKFNSISINRVIYDQFEVKIYFKNNNDTFIYAPSFCNLYFKNGLAYAKAGNFSKFIGTDFGYLQLSEFYGGVSTGYVEYVDHTPICLDLNEPIKKNLRLIQTHVIAPGFNEECIKYVFTKQGDPLPEPTFKIEFVEGRVKINASDEVINTWIERNKNGIKPKNYNGDFPMQYVYNRSNKNSKPIGFKGDVAFNVNDTKILGIENASTETINVLTNKMELIMQEVAEFVIENAEIVEPIQSTIDSSVNKVSAYENSTYIVNFILNTCNGEITEVNVLGAVPSMNESIKKTLLRLNGKYSVSQNNFCDFFTNTFRIKLE